MSAKELSPPVYLRHDKSLWRRVLLRTDTALALVLVAVIVWATTSVPFFDQPFTYSTLLLNIAPDPADGPPGDAHRGHR